MGMLSVVGVVVAKGETRASVTPPPLAKGCRGLEGEDCQYGGGGGYDNGGGGRCHYGVGGGCDYGGGVVWLRPAEIRVDVTVEDSGFERLSEPRNIFLPSVPSDETRRERVRESE